ncbi:unnamed protein product, partial [Closterium sp. NIES-53]
SLTLFVLPILLSRVSWLLLSLTLLRCRLDYATSLVAASESVCPPSVGGECALCTDVLEDRLEEFQCFAAA